MIDYCSGEKLDSRDNTAREMLLDNKYYTATVQVHSFEDVKSASVWDADNINAEIGAVIFKFGGDLGALDELKRGIDLWQADVQVFVTFFSCVSHCFRNVYSSTYGVFFFFKFV